MNKSVAAALLLLTACSGEPAETATPPAQAEAKAPAPQPAAQPRRVEEKGELLDFGYSWPAEAAAIAKLDQRFEAEMAERRAEALRFAQEDRADRGPDIPFHGHYFHKGWATMGDGGRLLSLAALTQVFTGGAHGNALYDVLLWDRTADEKIELADLFTDDDGAIAAMTPVYCAGLDAQRAEKRGAPVSPDGPDWMVQCRPLAESTVAPVDADGDGRFDLFRVLIEPYEAGAYVEGTYEVDIPVTAELRRMVKPEFGGSF